MTVLSSDVLSLVLESLVRERLPTTALNLVVADKDILSKLGGRRRRIVKQDPTEFEATSSSSWSVSEGLSSSRLTFVTTGEYPIIPEIESAFDKHGMDLAKVEAMDLFVNAYTKLLIVGPDLPVALADTLPNLRRLTVSSGTKTAFAKWETLQAILSAFTEASLLMPLVTPSTGATDAMLDLLSSPQLRFAHVRLDNVRATSGRNSYTGRGFEAELNEAHRLSVESIEGLSLEGYASRCACLVFPAFRPRRPSPLNAITHPPNHAACEASGPSGSRSAASHGATAARCRCRSTTRSAAEDDASSGTRSHLGRRGRSRSSVSSEGRPPNL